MNGGSARAQAGFSTVSIFVITLLLTVAILGADGYRTRQTDGSSEGSSLAVTVASTILDRTGPDSQPGSITYIYNLTVVNRGEAEIHVSPSSFRIATYSDLTFGVSTAHALSTPLRQVILAPGQSSTGQVSFQIPDNQVPAGLEYQGASDLPASLVASVPPVTEWVSTVDYANATLWGPHESQYLIVTEIQDSASFYYSNHGIVVVIMLQAFTPNASSIRVTSVSVATAGFTISGTMPSLPLPVQGDGTKAILTLTLIPPRQSMDVPDLLLNVYTS